MISAGLADEARTLVTYLAQHAKEHPVRGYQRLSILTAALTKDPALIVTTGASERILHLGAAIEASLRGDHAAAAVGLQEQVSDPTFTFDFPERAALVRELTTLRRPKDVAALCADTLQPPIVRPAFIVVRAQCLATAKR